MLISAHEEDNTIFGAIMTVFNTYDKWDFYSYPISIALGRPLDARTEGLAGHINRILKEE